MELKQIQTFVTLAATLHFGRAAEQLRIAQPHVSRRIRQLEEELKVSLFQRDTRKVGLTDAGRIFLADANNLLRDARLARDHVRESVLGLRGELKIGLVTNAMLAGLPRVLAEFRRQSPAVHLVLNEWGSALQIDALNEGVSDVAICHPPARMDPRLERLDFDREPLVAALPSAHRLARRASLDLRDLADEPWVMFPRGESAPVYDRIVAACNKAGYAPRIMQEAGPVHSRLGLVAAGYGVHLLHQSWRGVPFPGVAYVPTSPAVTLRMCCYWRRGDRSAILRLFVGIVRRNALASGEMKPRL